MQLKIDISSCDRFFDQYANLLESGNLLHPEKYPADLAKITRWGLQKSILYWYAKNIDRESIWNEKLGSRGLMHDTVENVYALTWMFGNTAESLVKSSSSAEVPSTKVIDEIKFSYLHFKTEPQKYLLVVGALIETEFNGKLDFRVQRPKTIEFIDLGESCSQAQSTKACKICHHVTPNPEKRKQTLFEMFATIVRDFYLGDSSFMQIFLPFIHFRQHIVSGRKICPRCTNCGAALPIDELFL